MIDIDMLYIYIVFADWIGQRLNFELTGFSFYVSCRASPILRVVNRECLMAVFSSGPQPHVSDGSVPCRTSTAAPDGSVPCQTSTANSGQQCSPPDLNRESEDMPDRVPERMSERMAEDMQNVKNNVKRFARRYVRQNVRRYARENQNERQKRCQK